jgi:hypothetical protein
MKGAQFEMQVESVEEGVLLVDAAMQASRRGQVLPQRMASRLPQLPPLLVLGQFGRRIAIASMAASSFCDISVLPLLSNEGR